MKKALIVGCTGLVGAQLLELLLQEAAYSEVIALSRRPLGRAHEKLVNVITDLHGLSQVANTLAANDVFCCLGTTIGVAGSKEAFKEVDYAYAYELAKITKDHGATQFLIVSAMGADKKSRIFYNQVKGEVEEGLMSLEFESLHIFRPSLLLGPRKERRVGEDIGKVISKLLYWFIPKNYRPIQYFKVANAMLHAARQEKTGTHIYLSRDLQRF
jgi:uncharacterized protein YbjT (DUF2867 family)